MNSRSEEFLQACLNGHFDKVKRIWINSPEDTITCLHTALQIACQNDQLEAVQFLSSEIGPEVNATKDASGRTVIFDASYFGHTRIVRYLVEHAGARVDILSSSGFPPVFDACYAGHLDTVSSIWELAPGTLKISNREGWTCLHAACRNGHLHIVQFLCKLGFDANKATFDKRTPLSEAVFKNHLHIVKHLIEVAGVIVTSHSFYLACHQGHINIAKYLFEKGNIDINFQSTRGFTPFTAACLKGHLDILKYFKEKVGICTTKDCISPEYAACASGHFSIVKYLREEYPKSIFSEANRDGITPFHAACRYGHTDIASYLWRSCNIDPHKADKNGVTPFMSAIQYGHNEILKLFHDDIGISKDVGSLFIACQKGDFQVLVYLIEVVGLNSSCRNSEGQTLLFVACMHGYFDIVKYLREKAGVDIRVPTNSGFTPFDCACHKGFFDIVNYLSEEVYGTFPSEPILVTTLNKDNYSGLYYSSRKGHFKIVAFLLSKGALVNSHTKGGDTALDIALANGHSEIANLLLSYGAYLDTAEYKRVASITRLVSSMWYTTSLHKACAENYVVILHELLTNATSVADVIECQSSDGWTPLHIGVFFNHLQIVKLLLESGANSFAKTSKGVTAFHIACSRGHIRMLKLLMSERFCSKLLHSFLLKQPNNT